MRSLPFDERKGCPPNYHKRASFTSKLGHRVPPRCIRSTTVYGESRRNFTRRLLARQQARLRTAGKSATRKIICPKGKIERHGYVRKFAPSILRNGYTVHRATGKDYRVYPKRSSVFVKPGCVLDRGLPGAGIATAPGPGSRPIGTLRKGELKKHGYVYLKPEHERHEALNKAIKEFGALGVYHKLDAISKLSMRTAPEASRVFKLDRKWLEEHHKLKAF